MLIQKRRRNNMAYVSKYTHREIEAKLDEAYAKYFVPQGYEVLMVQEGELMDSDKEKLFVKLN